MDHYVPQHLPLALRAFQLTRAPLKMLKVVWDKKKYKISIISGASLSIYILWKIGNERAKRNRDERTKFGRFRCPKTDFVFWKRLYYLIRICIPGFFTKEFFHLVMLTLFLLTRTILTISLANTMGVSVRALVEANFDNFIQGVSKVGLIAIPASFVNSGLKYFTNMFALYCRRRLTKYGHGKYLSGNTMYHKDLASIPDCDNRLTVDIEKFSLALSNIYTGTFKPLLDVVLFTNTLRYSLGIKGPILMFAYYFGAGILLRSIMPSFASLYSHQQRYEKNFQRNHARLLAHAEEIAFYGGNELEKTIIDDRFSLIFNKSRRIFRLQALVNILDNWLIKYGASMAGYAVVSKAVFGDARKLSASGKKLATTRAVSIRAELFTRNTQILVNLASSITQLVLLRKKLVSLSLVTARVAELFEKLEQCCSSYEQNEDTACCIRGNTISFENVDVVTPTNHIIIKDLSFEVQPENNLLIKGAEGSGKTSIFRLLSGIWPLKSGTITKPSHREIFYIPQHPYCPIGTLRDQVIYPMNQKQFNSDGHKDDELSLLLDDVNLGYLLSQYGWDTIVEWEIILSTSEIQRLAMTRILFHQPRFAILDRSTDEVDIDVEIAIYRKLKELKVTFITVTNHPSLESLHESVLTLKDEGKWEYEGTNFPLVSTIESEEQNE